MNIYALASLSAAVFCYLLALLVLLKGGRSAERRSFAYVTVFIGIWTLFPYLVSAAGEPSQALARARLVYAAAVFVPSLFFQFMLHTMRIVHEPREQTILKGSYLAAALFLASLSTPLFIRDVVQGPPNPTIRPGPLYLFFVLYFAYMYVHASRRLLQLYRTSQGRYREQLKYIGLAFIITVLAGVMHFASAYGVPEPFPHDVLIMGYSSLIAYAIVKHRIMDLRVAMTRIAILICAYAVLLGLPLALLRVYRTEVLRLLQDRLWIGGLFMTAYGLAASCWPFLYLYFQRKVERRLLRDQRRYQQTLLAASNGMTQVRDLTRLCRLIVHMITKTVGLRHAGIFLYEPKEEVFVLAARRYGRPDGSRLSKHDPTVELLQEVRQPVVLAELKAQLGDAEGKDGPTRKLARALAWMQHEQASVLVPSFAQEHLIGFLLLGEKRRGGIFTTEDLNVFATLANQAALAIENARFYQSEQERQAVLFHTASLSSLGTMASSMSHQVNNRFNVLSVIGAIRMEMLQQLLAQDAPDPAAVRKALEEDLAQFISVKEEAMRGGDIVKSIRKLITPSTEGHQPLAVVDAVHIALRVVQYKVPLDQVDLQLDLPETLSQIAGDTSQLGECFFNFVDNAWDAIKERQARLSPPPDYKGQIRIQGGAATTRDPQAKRTRFELLLTVSDNGIGVRPEDLPKLFVPFFTTKATAEKGTGLGLYVIKKIIEAHGGTITVASTYGQGTTFTIRLPALREPVHATPTTAPPRSA